MNPPQRQGPHGGGPCQDGLVTVMLSECGVVRAAGDSRDRNTASQSAASGVVWRRVLAVPPTNAQRSMMARKRASSRNVSHLGSMTSKTRWTSCASYARSRHSMAASRSSSPACRRANAYGGTYCSARHRFQGVQQILGFTRPSEPGEHVAAKRDHLAVATAEQTRLSAAHRAQHRSGPAARRPARVDSTPPRIPD